jgi:hypothetical protein
MRSFQELQQEVILQNKNGINFLVAGSFCWLSIALIWYFPGPALDKAYLTFCASALMMPIAFLFSRLFNSKWKIANNPLNGLGLWLNLAQLLYFPFVFIFMGKNPEQMPMALAIITGAHFFPYAWFYQSKGYAVLAGVIVICSTLLGTSGSIDNPSLWIALLMAGMLLVLSLWSYVDYRKVAARCPSHHLNENSLQQSGLTPEFL